MWFKLFGLDRRVFAVAQPGPVKRFRHWRSLPIPATAVLACIVMLLAEVGHAQLGKADLMLLNGGLQLQSLVQYNDIFTLSTYTNANFTSINWGYTSSPSLMGPAPGIPWSRWVTDPTQMPPQNGENAYMSTLLSLELSDEPNLEDGPTYTNEVNWFLSAETNFSNTVLYVNNYGGQVDDTTLGNFISAANPDMLCFDEYPFTSQYDTNYTNDIGQANSWPFTSWYSELRRYRQWGISANIPVATYMQTFHAVQSYDSTVYRYPSLSEMRLNTFAALAFNCKWLIGFEYNAGATTLFDILPNGYSGDTYPNTNYTEQIDIALRAQNFGRSLVCLKPVYDLHNPNDNNPPPGPASGNTSFPDGTTTSILILKGNPTTSSNTPEPIGFQDDPGLTKSASWWEELKNDPYLAGWAVTNYGIFNGGVAGQVFISWFTPIDERLDGPNYSNEVYFLVVNGLTAPTGVASNCLQDVHLNFLNKFTNIVMLNPETGTLQTNAVPLISLRRQLDLYLNGGDAALFKIDDGAPFVGHVPPGTPGVSVTQQNGNIALNIQGNQGARYQVQSNSSVNGTNWTTLTNFVLLNPTTTFVAGAATNSCFYRVAGIP